MALVCGEIFSNTSSGSSPRVFSSISAKTGFAPTNCGTLAVDMKVNEGTITSSPLPTPWASSAAWVADVPELNVRQYLLPIKAAISCSNSATFGPAAQLTPDLIASFTSMISSSSQYIRNNGIFQVMVCPLDLLL